MAPALGCASVPTMFRRRTDQVYSTLQQVQRRITEQNASIAPPPAGLATMPSEPRRGDSVAPHLMPLAGALPANRPPPSQVINDDGGANLPRSRRHLQISVSLAATICLLWITSFAIALMLGGRLATERQIASHPPVMTPVVGSTPAITPDTSGPKIGPDVLVMWSAPNATTEIDKDLTSRAAKLNELIGQGKSISGPPLFGVRKPKNGGIELVYGAQGGDIFGVVKEEHQELQRKLAGARDKGGFGFVSAKWVSR